MPQLFSQVRTSSTMKWFPDLEHGAHRSDECLGSESENHGHTNIFNMTCFYRSPEPNITVLPRSNTSCLVLFRDKHLYQEFSTVSRPGAARGRRIMREIYWNAMATY
jgi:hypothetical protein